MREKNLFFFQIRRLIFEKGRKSSMDGPPTSKIFFHQLSINTYRPVRNFGLGHPHRDFMLIFRKIVFETFFSNFYCNLPRKLGKSRKLVKNVQNDFSEKWHKIPMRRPPTEISGDPQCFDRNFVEKQFRGRGAPIDDLGPFFQKSKPEISAKWEKTCFLCCRFF